MVRRAQEKKSFSHFDEKYNYVFLDESGNSSSGVWKKIEENIKENGYLSREFSTFTLSGVFFKSKRQYDFLTKEMRLLKQNVLHVSPQTFVHRTSIKNNKFLSENLIKDKSVTWKFESELLNLVSKHKLPIFSVSFNRELMYQKPTFDFNYYHTQFNILKVCVEKIIKSLFFYLSKKYENEAKIKKTVLVFENSNKRNEKNILIVYNALMHKFPKYRLYFKNLMFCSKSDIKKNPISGNELVDFVNYASWIWASNFYYQKIKTQFPNYPTHLKNSFSIIDKDVRPRI